MRCEHDNRTLELPGLGEPARGFSLAALLQQRAELQRTLAIAETKPASRGGRGPYRKAWATEWGRRRAALGLTMRELAELAGVGLRTIERIERGHKPSLGVEIQLHEALRRAEAKQ